MKAAEIVYNLMKEEGNKIVVVYTKVSFRNPSYFSTAFNKQYPYRTDVSWRHRIAIIKDKIFTIFVDILWKSIIFAAQ